MSSTRSQAQSSKDANASATEIQKWTDWATDVEINHNYPRGSLVKLTKGDQLT